MAVVPLPGVLWISILPPCACTIDWQMLSPRPVPPGCILALARFVAAIESLEDVRQIERRNAHAGVAHRDDHFLLLAVVDQVDGDRSARRGELDGVVDQVVDDLLQAMGVAADG